MCNPSDVCHVRWPVRRSFSVGVSSQSVGGRLIYDTYQPLFDEHKKSVQEGLDLFTKHFGSFWY